MKEKKLLHNIINDSNTNYWEVKDNSSYWSESFLKTLGYNKNEIESEIVYFLDHLINEDHREEFRDNYFSLIKNNIDFKQDIQILCKNGKFKEFNCLTNGKLPIKVKQNPKTIFFKEKKVITNDKVKKDTFYYRESAEMLKTGSWYVDFIKQKSYWDGQTRKILEYPEDYLPSLKDSEKYYAEEHHNLAAKSFLKCGMEGMAFNTEIKMVTANKREFWVRAIGKPVFNNEKEIIGIRGVFQDIDEEKSKILVLQKTSDIIASQNSRLFNFAHIVSHNLRSHTSNLTLISELIENTTNIEDKLDMLDNVKDISKSLNATINHLNEVVTIQTQTNQNKVKVSFSKTLDQVKKSISRIISKSKTTLFADFSKLEHLDYIPAYLESILLNLITNAIKYKHPSRNPEITIKTYIENKKRHLTIRDNGIGIDMDKYGNKLFGMYNTFHFNEDAVGIGLFITKNQIEALNGQIFVDSEVEKGTVFKIQF